jgi:hypothetical protein
MPEEEEEEEEEEEGGGAGEKEAEGRSREDTPFLLDARERWATVACT